MLAATLGVAGGLGAALAQRWHRPGTGAVLQPFSGSTTWPAGARRAPAFVLRDEVGTRTALASLRGRPVLLTFLDSVCKHECPLEGRVLRDVQSAVRETRAVTAVVSVDPWSDTPATVAAFARKAGWQGTWHWFLGSRAQLARVWNAYDITVQREHGDVVHTVALYVIDAHGDLRAAYLFPFSPQSVAGAVRRLASAA